MAETTPEREWWHGTISGYYGKDYSCRCDDCRAAARRYYHEKVKTAPAKPCEVEGCTKNARPRSRKCAGHLTRLRTTGSVGPAQTRTMNGEDSGYEAAHKRVRRARGRARENICSQCGERQAKDWAYIHGSPGEKPAGIAPNGRPHGPYSLNPEHYTPMCNPCHTVYDLDASGAEPGRVRKAAMRRQGRLAS